MSVTSRQRASAWRATRMLTMSLSMRLISAGEPAPSITTTSFSARSRSSAAVICGHTAALRSCQGMRESASLAWPSSTTWLCVSFSGLSSTGFISTPGSARAASAWKYWALPISPPDGSEPVPATTRALLLMFCALNGATFRPWRAYQRHSAVASQLLPAPLVVPSTITQRAVMGGRAALIRSAARPTAPPANGCRCGAGTPAPARGGCCRGRMRPGARRSLRP